MLVRASTSTVSRGIKALRVYPKDTNTAALFAAELSLQLSHFTLPYRGRHTSQLRFQNDRDVVKNDRGNYSTGPSTMSNLDLSILWDVLFIIKF